MLVNTSLAGGKREAGFSAAIARSTTLSLPGRLEVSSSTYQSTNPCIPPYPASIELSLLSHAHASSYTLTLTYKADPK